MEESNNLQDLFGDVLQQPKKSSKKEDVVINLLSPAKSTNTGEVFDLCSPSPQAKSSAKAALFTRQTIANAKTNTNQDEIISVHDTDDEDENEGFLRHAIHDIEGDKRILAHLINEYHLAVIDYSPFQKNVFELYDEIVRLIKNGLFTEKGSYGVGVSDNVKRGPVHISLLGGQSPIALKQFLTQHGSKIVLEYIEMWEQLCENSDMEIVSAWITNYRSEFHDEKEEKRHTSRPGWLPFGYMVDHGDTFPDEVIARVTTTMFENTSGKGGKVRKRFRVKNKDPSDEYHGMGAASFAAGNGTTVIMDAEGAGHFSEWEHGVEGAEDTYTITLQLKKKSVRASGQAVGNPKDDRNY